MGIVFDIKRFSIKDGPRIRTSVFLKGCPLRCVWCHNPESQWMTPELCFTPEKCIGCERCLTHCPRHCHRMENGAHVLDRKNCTRCGHCAAGCPSDALEMAGRETDVAAVMTEVLSDRIFYRKSGGGLTLNGGEPMMQFEFTRELLAAAKAEGISTALDTCGYAPWREFRELLSLADLFLYDFKTVDPELHRELTGRDNSLILENLRKLDEAGAAIFLRCPLVPGVNDDRSHLAAIAELAETLSGVKEVTLEPYHPLGVEKSVRFGDGGRFDLQDFTPRKTAEDLRTNSVRGRTFIPGRTFIRNGIATRLPRNGS